MILQDVKPDPRGFVNMAAAMRNAQAAARAATESIREATRSLPRGTTLEALVALHATGRHMYAGTVPQAVTERNRARNKAGRRQRRVNRLRGFRKGVR